MKKIKVSKELCICCGACVSIDSEHFDFDDNGKSSPISNNHLESNNLTNAIEACPTSAISIIECENNECDDTHDICKCRECDCNHEENCQNHIN